jgi:nicotinamidase-related amidase
MSWRLEPEKTALLVIDVQEKLLPVIAERDRVMKKITDMIRMAKLLDMSIYVTEQVPEKLGQTAQALRDLLPQCPLLSKREFSSFSSLRFRTPKNFVVVGLETHVCVRQTVYDLRQNEKSVYVLADAVSSRSLMDHQLALAEMRQDKVLITSVEAVCWELLRSVDHPQFREALAILK